MNVAHDQNACLPGHPQGRLGDSCQDGSSPLDWQDLRSRLLAAHDLRVALAEDSGPRRFSIRGSFDDGAASMLTTYEGLQRAVNPTASTYLKPREDIVSPVADTSSTGGRG